MKTEINDFKDLEVWQKSIKLVKQVYQSTGQFPKTEQFALTSQIRRSAVSIPSNISEGHERKGIKEFSHFVSIALGSAAELETQLIIAGELSYLSGDEAALLLAPIQSVRMMLIKLYNSLSGK